MRGPLEKNDGFDLAGYASFGCFDCRFILVEEISWVGVSVILREDGRFDAWRLLELFELHRKRGGCRGLLVVADAATASYVFAFFFVGVQLFFNDDGSWEKPYNLRCVRHRRWFWARGLILL